MTAEAILERAQSVGVCLHLDDGQVRLSGDKSAIAALLPDLRNHRAELVQLLSKKSIDQTPPPPPPDPGMARLLALGMRFCDAIQASDKARQDWRSDIEATPAQDRQGLAQYLRGELAKLVPPVAPKAAPPTATPAPTAAQTWRQADKADQLHHWGCTQCRTGPKCSEGQRLSDIYIEAATRERFIAAKPDPAKPLPKFHAAQPWCAADREYQAHHWQCPMCKAAARSGGHSQRCTEGQHLYNLYEQAAMATTKESA